MHVVSSAPVILYLILAFRRSGSGLFIRSPKGLINADAECEDTSQNRSGKLGETDSHQVIMNHLHALCKVLLSDFAQNNAQDNSRD